MLTLQEQRRNKKIKNALDTAVEREKAKMDAMPPDIKKKYALQRLMSEGIVDENGALTKEYGDGSNPNTAERSEELYKQIKEEDRL